MPPRLRLFLPALALTIGLAGSSAAQQFAAAPPGVLENLNALASEPAAHSSFTFDRTELQFAEQFIDSGRAGADKGAIASLNSVTVDSFHYTKPAFYDPEVLTAIQRSYHGAGWEHLVNANARPAANATGPTTPPLMTDLWLHFHGAEIDNVTVLVRGVREMNMVQVTGALRPLDLIHLSGHFGIPKVDPGAIMVPAPAGK